ncbi:MAG: ATP-binding protein, partial [Pseudomonadota bacterium]
AIKLKLQTVAAGATQAPPKNSDLNELVGDVSTAIDDMRRISHDLSPALLENQGLAAAMQSQADRVAQGSGLVIDIVRDSPILLPAERATHVYRIFQEALNNAIAHGRSSRITATLMQTGTHLTMKVQDNGTGISGPDAPDKTDGLGLKSMHNRARVLGGTLELSGNRTGTLLVLRIPSAAP